MAIYQSRMRPITARLQLSSRNFGINRSSRRNLTFSTTVETCCIAAHDTLIGLHATTGLPWVAVLPLAAITVRAAFVTPLEIWARHHRNKANIARPLLSAWRPTLQKKAYEENSGHGPAVTHKFFLLSMRAKRKEIYSRLGVRTSPLFAPILQLPVFLVVIETIRKMCGTNEGLLGLITKSVSSKESDSATIASDSTAVIPLETTFAQEGGLWFQDLLAPDPQLLLPFALSAALFANVRLSQWQMDSQGIEHTKWSKRISRIMQMIALAAGPLTLSVPSAMLVYWTASSTSAMLIHMVLWKAMPSPMMSQKAKLGPK